MDRALIIFQNNNEAEKIKPRLSETIGVVGAQQVYQTLLIHTHRVACAVEAQKWLYYSERLEAGWQAQADYTLRIQQGYDLGERLCHAFGDVFSSNHYQAISIRNDCPNLQVEIINEAFEALGMYDVVIGPSNDGGYYLIGMNRLYATLFAHKQWNNATVFHDTLNDSSNMGLRVYQLPQLNSIHTETDLKNYPKFQFHATE